MNSRLRLLATVGIIFGVTGGLLNGIMDAYVEDRRRSGSTALGGIRALAADLAWLSLQGAWERRDWRTCTALIRIATGLDPASAFFWRNGARILAFDVPVWRIAEAGGVRAVLPDEQRRIYREQATIALEVLRQAIRTQPLEAALWLECGSVELHGNHDPAAAAASYGRAWELSPELTFAARLQSQLLVRLGRADEALVGLGRLHRYLTTRGRSAEAALVSSRIDALPLENAEGAENSSQSPE